MPGPKLSRHPDDVASSVSVYDNLFTVIKVRSINNSLGYRNLDNTIGVVKTKSRKSNDSATKNAICKCGCESPPDEGGTSCVQESTNHMADICISECNDRDEVKVVKSISECKFSECQINFFPIRTLCNIPMASINLNKIKKSLLRHSKFTSGSSSKIEEVDKRLEAVTTGARDVKFNTVVSIPAAFGG